MTNFKDRNGERIPDGMLPLGADWSAASDQEVQKALNDPEAHIKLGWVLAVGPLGVEVADAAIEGKLQERIAEQNARMRALNLDED